VVQHDHAVGSLLHLGQVTARHHHSASRIGQAAQERTQSADVKRVQTVGGLIENENTRVTEQCGGKAKAAAYARGAGPDLPLRNILCIGDCQHLVHPADWDSGFGGGQQQVLAAGVSRVCAAIVECHPHLPGPAWESREGSAEDGSGAAVRGDQAGQYPQAGRFSGAARPEESGNLAELYGKGRILDGGTGAIAFGQSGK
jgi:hypothetical protein